MANLNALSNNCSNISQALKKYNQKEYTADDLLISYRHAIKQVPDTFNKQSKNGKLKPQPIPVSLLNIESAIKHKDPILIAKGFDPKKMRDTLVDYTKQGRKWILFDYAKKGIVDSSPKNVNHIVSNYYNGMTKQLAKERQKTANNDFELNLDL